jgi:glycosyltransferase involved in cell wall biosynthesis
MIWFCIQNGAREHYAIPRALKLSGRLDTLLTEVWAGPVLRRLAFGPLRTVATRFHQDLANARVVDWTWKTLISRITQTPKHRNTNPYGCFLRDGRWFSENVRNYLVRHGTDVRGKVIFSYDTTALELFRWAKERGAICVLGQMDPNRVESELVQDEEKRWPGWAIAERGEQSAEGRAKNLEEYFQRREREWALADRIIVNSRWSFDALVKQGVPAEKLAVIPLCYEVPSAERGAQSGGETTPTAKHQTPSMVRVLFLGQVILRKGIQYLVEAAKLLEKVPVHFDVVGGIGISEESVKLVPANMTFHGSVSRDRAAAWYRQCDVFVLPTISDGFAITQLEAMAHGLPVIATPNCGGVVSNGMDGFIVPARDAVALAQAIRRYQAEPGLLQSQQGAALAKSKQFTLDKLAEGLAALEDNLRYDNGPLTTGH